MKITLESDRQVWVAGQTGVVRLKALNDGFQPADVDRSLLVGPNGYSHDAGRPFPISVEPGGAGSRIKLQPFAYCGRERTFSNLRPGRYTFYGYLLKKATPDLLTEGPRKATLLAAKAEPLTITVVENPIIINLSLSIT